MLMFKGSSVLLWLSTCVSVAFAADADAAASKAKKYIVPGARWYDTAGNLISAHAGGITREEETGRFYWFGENKVEGQVEGEYRLLLRSPVSDQ